MNNDFLSPNGQLGSAEFIRAGFILILIGAAFGMTKIINPNLGAMFGVLSIFLLYPWVCIWIKRLRHGEQSGWMIFLYILIYGVILLIGVFIVIIMFGGSEFSTLIQDKVSGNISQAEYIKGIEAMAPDLALPITITGLLSSLLTLFIADKTIPSHKDGHSLDQ
ncbi:MAG: hypothetical protein JKX72_07500 [Robiginitomaculum sp.]|nr:hypothetical protein [Robiginitomaculum sp.]